MKKSEFLQKKYQLENHISELKSELCSLKKEYIESNINFEIGELIKIVFPEQKNFNRKIEERVEFGYVDGFELNYNSQVIPILFKQKNDGSKSKIRLYVGGDCIFSKIEKNNL